MVIEFNKNCQMQLSVIKQLMKIKNGFVLEMAAGGSAQLKPVTGIIHWSVKHDPKEQRAQVQMIFYTLTD